AAGGRVVGGPPGCSSHRAADRVHRERVVNAAPGVLRPRLAVRPRSGRAPQLLRVSSKGDADPPRPAAAPQRYSTHNRIRVLAGAELTTVGGFAIPAERLSARQHLDGPIAG